jgi:hypothetical protein
MKYLLLLVFVLLCFHRNQAQTVFAPTDAVWHFEHLVDIDPPGLNYSKYAKEKDTLYFGKNCSKIIGQTIISTGKNYDTTLVPPQYFYTNGDTVFYYSNYYAQFYPIYIFNVNKGDSFRVHIPHPPTVGSSTDTTILVKIDSTSIITIDGISLRKVYTHHFPPTVYLYLGTYVERIGALNADNPIGFSQDNGGIDGGIVRCYKDNLIDTILQKGITNCDFIEALGIFEPSPIVQRPKISPNPFADRITIDSKELNEQGSILFYNIMGTVQLEYKYSKGSPCNIDTHSLGSGIYYCSFMNAEGRLLWNQLLIKE